MAVTHRDSTPFHTRIAEEQLPDRRERVDYGLLARHIVGDAVLRVGGRCLNVPAQTQVQGQARVNAEIILHEQSCVPAIGISRDGRVLRDCAWNTDQEIRQRVPGHAVIEGEDAVVVQQRLLNVLVE